MHSPRKDPRSPTHLDFKPMLRLTAIIVSITSSRGRVFGGRLGPSSPPRMGPVQAVILAEMWIYVVGGYGPVEPSDGRQGFAQHLRVDPALGDHPTVDRDHR